MVVYVSNRRGQALVRYPDWSHGVMAIGRLLWCDGRDITIQIEVITITHPMMVWWMKGWR